jgi:hypothetical protein
VLTPYLALAIAGFCAFGAALFWVSIWSNLKPRSQARASSRPVASADLAAAKR